MQLDFQDSVGSAMLNICQTVPGGVLMFMPSYALMEKLSRRWQVRVLCVLCGWGWDWDWVAGVGGGVIRWAPTQLATDGRRICQRTQPPVHLTPQHPHIPHLPAPHQATGLWRQLEGVKHVFSEPRQAGDAFDKAIARYYAAIKSGKGGLFLAVCRGKVSALGGDHGLFGTDDSV